MNMYYIHIVSHLLIDLIFYCLTLFYLGRYDLCHCTYYCNNCDEQCSPATLDKIINEGYWPGSPTTFNHAFSEDVFRLWDSVRKHMPGTSETAFLRSLGDLSRKRGRVCYTCILYFKCYLTTYNYLMLVTGDSNLA